MNEAQKIALIQFVMGRSWIAAQKVLIIVLIVEDRPLTMEELQNHMGRSRRSVQRVMGYLLSNRVICAEDIGVNRIKYRYVLNSSFVEHAS